MYEKKISAEEAKCAFILLHKDKRALFPDSGKRFNLTFRGNTVPVVIEEIPCTCVGPEKPHVHYHLHHPVALKKGDTVKITKTDGDYELEIN